MARVRGRNGVVFEVADSVAASLVAAGDAEYVEQEMPEKAAPKKAAKRGKSE